MPTTAFLAHYDGQQIRVDEPFDLAPNTRLVVTVLPQEGSDETRDVWLHVSAQGLAAAYGENEPDYSPHMIKEDNPDYEGR